VYSKDSKNKEGTQVPKNNLAVEVLYMPEQDPAQQRSIVPNQTGQKNARLEKMENIFRRQEAGKRKKVNRGPGI
jgi:hypothetical protein